MKTAALYIRVSTHDQEELSPDAQKRLLLSYAKEHELVTSNELIFLEKGISGRKAEKRPEFMKMVSMAKSKEHPIDVILVWKFSRFARNQEESIVYKSLLRKQHNVEVISISEPIIDGPFGSLIERIIEWMDEYYSIRLSGEVFRGMSEKAMRGGYQARPPLGYAIVYPGKPPEIVPEEAEVVRMIFRKYVDEHLPIYNICQQLNTLGLTTSRGKPFEKRSLEYILQNPTYIGKIRWNRTENATNRIKDREEWILQDGEHPAIITQETFEAAQKRFQSEYRPKNGRPAAVCKHWLSGLLKCSACGRTLSSSKQRVGKNQNVYYSFNCYGYLKGKCSVSHSIPAHKAETAVKEIIHRDLVQDDFTFLELAPKQEDNLKKILEDQLEKLSAKEARIKQAYRDGIDTLEEYKDNKEILRKEREQLEARLSACVPKPALDNRERIREKLQTVYDIICSDDFSIEEKNLALKSVVLRIVYNKPEDSLEICYYNDAANPDIS